MKSGIEMFKYVISNFFTHKDFLIDVNLLPGTLYSPMHILLETIFLIFVVSYAKHLSKNKKNIKKVFIILWSILCFLEISILLWDSFSKRVNGLDFKEGLSLYPCSIFLFILPYLIWGKNKKIAYGYIGTLGLVGSLINLIYPYRLENYSIISFPAFHSIFYHGSMFFVYLVLVFSKVKIYNARKLKDLFYPFIPTLLMSIPANILNYSSLDSDYMYFKGYHKSVQFLFPDIKPIEFTIILYGIYLLLSVLFYLPSFFKYQRNKEQIDTNLFEKFI